MAMDAPVLRPVEGDDDDDGEALLPAACGLVVAVEVALVDADVTDEVPVDVVDPIVEDDVFEDVVAVLAGTELLSVTRGDVPETPSSPTT